MSWYVAYVVRVKEAHKILIAKPEQRPNRKWKAYNKTFL